MEDLHLSEDQVKHISGLRSNKKGLTSEEAEKRIIQYGPNVVATQKKQNLLKSLLARFNNPLVIILIIASCVSAFTGSYADFVIIICIVIISVALDFFQEYQSAAAADKLKQKASIHTWVYRDGQRMELVAAHLTVGDLINLTTGDVVPADAEVVSSVDFHVDESALTGESYPVGKAEGEGVFMGSTVVNGEGLCVVTAVGAATRFGSIAESLAKVRPETDFERGMKKFGYLVMQVTIGLIMMIFLAHIVMKHDLFQSFLFAVALAVGLTPELLPMVVTVNLAQGATRMAKKGVIVKHLPSIQNFGGMNILCTDKTGTITENKIKLEKYENAGGEEDTEVLRLAYLNSLYQANLKSPLDEAVLAHKEAHEKNISKITEIPFDFIRKRLSVVVATQDHELKLICKGAPESVNEQCNCVVVGGHVQSLDDSLRLKLKKRYEQLSSEGYRVLTVAYRKVDEKESFSKSDEKDLVFAGYTAFLDPPKHSVKAVLADLKSAGVGLKILTGDSELVTKKICDELGIEVSGVVVGQQLVHVSDRAMQRIATQNTIFARLTPAQKERLILALKKEGNVVGYMGDGVNDAPPLRAADIGISVDNAVDVAKESADIILTKKSLRVLHDGIVEGRRTFANTMKYIFMGMGSNFGNMMSVSIASLLFPFLPMLPIQILLNNLMYDLSQLALPTDNVDESELKEPKRWNMKYIRQAIITFGPISSFFDFVTFYVLLYVLHVGVAAFRTGWFMESLISQSLIILASRTHKVPFWKSTPSKYLILSVLATSVASVFIAQTWVGSYFKFVSVPLNFWIYLIGIVIIYVGIVEVAKVRFFKYIK